jgi:CheY-like chemotaxis protein
MKGAEIYSHRPETPMNNLRVLIADDNEDAARTISLLISTLGAHGEAVHGGEQAVAKALEFRPHLILMDIGMPGMDGYEACRTIRRQDWGKDLMIVALTGWGQDKDKEKAAEAGFNKHLVKPVGMAALEQLLDECQRGQTAES